MSVLVGGVDGLKFISISYDLLAFPCCEIGHCQIITPMSPHRVKPKWIETALQEAQLESIRYVLCNDVYNKRLMCVEGVALGSAFRVRVFYILSTSLKKYIYARSGKGGKRKWRTQTEEVSVVGCENNLKLSFFLAEHEFAANSLTSWRK